MAITNAQQYQQLVNKPADGKRPGYRGDDAARASGRSKGKATSRDTTRAAPPSGTPRGDGPASRGFQQSEQPGLQDPSVYGATGKQYDPDAALAAATAQGKFDKKNPIEKFIDTYTSTGRKNLYNIFPNNPRNELDYLRSLPASQRALLSPALRAKLEALELDEDQDLLDTANTKFTFDEFEELRKFQPTEGLNFAEYAAKYKGAPGLLYSGDVGNLITIKNPDGTYRYERRRDDGPDQPIIPIIPKPVEPGEGDDEVTSPGGGRDMGGLAPRFAGSIFDFTGLADGGRVPAMGGGIMNNDIIGGFADGSIDEMGRQMYGLGKLVKKATRGIKKIVKSPLGKAALIGGLGFLGMKSPAISGFFKNKFMPFMFEGGKFDLSKLTGKGALAGIGALSALPLLFGQDDEEEFDPYRGPSIDIANIRANPYNFLAPRFQGTRFAADGGIMRTGYQEGGDAEPVAKKTMPLIDMDGKEKDYRETGGFVDMGRMERADDVPARLSKNEFVFTADAVRNAGDGDIDKGAEVMYNMMKNLEDGGNVSEESQGLEGARNMFQTSQRLEEVL
jgi:hypothetical protein